MHRTGDALEGLAPLPAPIANRMAVPKSCTTSVRSRTNHTVFENMWDARSPSAYTLQAGSRRSSVRISFLSVNRGIASEAMTIPLHDQFALRSELPNDSRGGTGFDREL